MKVQLIPLAAVATALFAAPAAFAATKPAAPATASAPAKSDAAPKVKHHKKAMKKHTEAAPAAAH
jgi:hypothetical protein